MDVSRVVSYDTNLGGIGLAPSTGAEEAAQKENNTERNPAVLSKCILLFYNLAKFIGGI